MSLLKKKTEGLTPEEAVEQAKLREEYIEGYRRSVRHHIEGIKIVDEEGNDVTPEKLRQVQREKVCMAVVSMTLIHKQKSAGRDSSTLCIFKIQNILD